MSPLFNNQSWLSLSKPANSFCNLFLTSMTDLLNPLDILNTFKALFHHLDRLGIVVHQDEPSAHFQADRADGA